MSNLLVTSHNIGNSKLDAVQELYALGFNVLPLEFGSKRPAGNWKMLQTTRLPAGCLDLQFESRNVGVLVGRTSMNLFVVDCDTDDAFKYWQTILHARGLDKWVVSSLQGGHFWFLSEEGEVKTVWEKKKQPYKPENAYQIWGQNHYMVAPPSVRIMDGPFSGFVYSWLCREGELPPVLSVSEIEAIFPKVKVIRSLMADRMTRLAYMAIIEHSNRGYASHSEAEFAAICSLLRIGWDEEEIMALFDKYQPRHYFKVGSNEDWLYKHMIVPAKSVVKNSRGEAIQNALAWSGSRKWAGRSGALEKLVFEACCKRAKVQGPYRFRATVREIAEHINRTAKTTNKYLRRLVEAGWLKLLTQQKPPTPEKPNGGVKEANYFGISEEIINYHSGETTICTIPVVLSSGFRGHDVWHVYGLGKNALFVYEYLLCQPRFRSETVEEITSALSNQIDTKSKAVKIALARLSSVGLAKEEDGKWKSIHMELGKLDEIAEKIGVLGRAKKRQDYHAAERAGHALHVLVSTQKPPLKKDTDAYVQSPETDNAVILEEQVNTVSIS